jgi:hypothetical protein
VGVKDDKAGGAEAVTVETAVKAEKKVDANSLADENEQKLAGAGVDVEGEIARTANIPSSTSDRKGVKNKFKELLGRS